MNCYCGQIQSFQDCCEPLHLRKRSAQTAQELMRSRYSAFCTLNIAYLIETTDPQVRASVRAEDYQEWASMALFKKLEILKAEESGNKAIVEFKAVYDLKDAPEQIHHEISKFRKQGGIWYYREGRPGSSVK